LTGIAAVMLCHLPANCYRQYNFSKNVIIFVTKWVIKHYLCPEYAVDKLP